jgi:hypothetical protein
MVSVNTDVDAVGDSAGAMCVTEVAALGGGGSMARGEGIDRARSPAVGVLAGDSPESQPATNAARTQRHAATTLHPNTARLCCRIRFRHARITPPFSSSFHPQFVG